MLATAANFETRTNGATHMGNDDCTIFDGMAHLKIIDVSCPQQMLSLMKWIMEGNRGPALRARDAHALRRALRPRLRVRVRQGLRPARERRPIARSSSAAGAACTRRWRRPRRAPARGCTVGVVDMPSIDEDLLLALCESGKLVCPRRTEQRLHPAEPSQGAVPPPQGVAGRAWRAILAINTLDAEGRPQFIHSGTYEELIEASACRRPQIARVDRSPPGVSSHECSGDSRKRRRGAGSAGPASRGWSSAADTPCSPSTARPA